MPRSRDATILVNKPPRAPSQVFPGLMAGMRECFPQVLPQKKALVSLANVVNIAHNTNSLPYTRSLKLTQWLSIQPMYNIPATVHAQLLKACSLGVLNSSQTNEMTMTEVIRRGVAVG